MSTRKHELRGCGSIVIDDTEGTDATNEISVNEIKKDIRKLRKILKQHKIKESGVNPSQSEGLAPSKLGDNINVSQPRISNELKKSVNDSIKKYNNSESLSDKEYEDLVLYNEKIKTYKLPTIIKKRELINNIINKKVVPKEAPKEEKEIDLESPVEIDKDHSESEGEVKVVLKTKPNQKRTKRIRKQRPKTDEEFIKSITEKYVSAKPKPKTKQTKRDKKLIEESKKILEKMESKPEAKQTDEELYEKALREFTLASRKKNKKSKE